MSSAQRTRANKLQQTCLRGIMWAAAPTHNNIAARCELPHQLSKGLRLERTRGGLPTAAPVTSGGGVVGGREWPSLQSTCSAGHRRRWGHAEHLQRRRGRARTGLAYQEGVGARSSPPASTRPWSPVRVPPLGARGCESGETRRRNNGVRKKEKGKTIFGF